MHVVNVRKAASRKCPQQVQRGGRLCVSLKHLLRRRRTGGLGEFKFVDDVAAIGRQIHAVHGLGRRRARLCELSGHSAHLHNRDLCAVGEHDCHLEKHLERVPDVVSRELRKALSAISALQQEALSARHGRELAPQGPCLSGEDKRRILCKLLLDSLQSDVIRIIRHLHPGLRSPPGLLPVVHFWVLKVPLGRGRHLYRRDTWKETATTQNSDSLILAKRADSWSV